MSNHVKPTTEELEANAQKALAEAEEMKKKDTHPIVEENKPEENKEETKKQDADQDKDKEVENKSTDKKEEVKKTETESTAEENKDADYKKKFASSTRESQIQASLNRKMAEALEKAANPPEPTDEELLTANPNWEEMSDFEKRTAKKDMMNDRRFTGLNEVTKEFKDFDVWKGKVDSFVDDPQTLISNPLLEGKEEEFKLFCLKEKYQGADLDLIVSAFLYRTNADKPKNKGKMFETGTAGPNDPVKPKTDKLTVEQGRSLRESNYEQWKKMMMAGKIEQVS